MSLDQSNTIDAMGIERESRFAVLTILDHWDWHDEGKHLVALQSKLNAYFTFIESGQYSEACPDTPGRPIIIDVIAKFPFPPAGLEFLKRAQEAGSEMDVAIRQRHYPGKSNPD